MSQVRWCVVIQAGHCFMPAILPIKLTLWKEGTKVEWVWEKKQQGEKNISNQFIHSRFLLHRSFIWNCVTGLTVLLWEDYFQTQALVPLEDTLRDRDREGLLCFSLSLLQMPPLPCILQQVQESTLSHTLEPGWFQARSPWALLTPRSYSKISALVIYATKPLC